MAGFSFAPKKLSLDAILNAGGASQSDVDQIKAGPTSQVVYQGAELSRITAADMLSNSGFTIKPGIYLLAKRQDWAERWIIVVPDVNKDAAGPYDPEITSGETHVFWSRYDGQFQSFERRSLRPSGGGVLAIGYVEYLPFT